MHQTRKRIRLSALLTTLLIVLHASNILAMTSHTIHIEWDYESYTAPIDAELSAYRLYKDGVKVCQFDYPYDFEGDCKILSDSGLFNFTLTAVFDDGTESPRSAPFPFMLVSDTAAQPDVLQSGVLIAVLSLLLK